MSGYQGVRVSGWRCVSVQVPHHFLLWPNWGVGRGASITACAWGGPASRAQWRGGFMASLREAEGFGSHK